MAKLVVPVTKAVAVGEDAPGDHDASDPDAGADLLHDHVARHFEQEIGPVEGADGEAEVGGRHAEVARAW